MKVLLKFLDKVPKYLKEGPWSNVAYIFIIAYAIYLIYTMPPISSILSTHDSMRSISRSDSLQWFRLLVGSYGALLDIMVVYHAGFFPFSSYTLTSWNFMTARLLFAYFGQYSQTAQVIANAVRFPALVGNSITVLMWWLVLTPLIDYLLRHDKEERGRFRKFNISPLLVNIHFLNLPVVATEFLWTGVLLKDTDLWFGLLAGFLYLNYYLWVLDAAGFHFYIIMTPRTPWCLVSYFGIIGLYFAAYFGWNSALSYYQS